MMVKTLTWMMAVCLLMVSGTGRLHAQDTCTLDVAALVESVDAACAPTQRGQACYAAGTVSVEARSDGAAFSAPGDILALSEVESVASAPDGLVVLDLQADQPSAANDQFVRVILFGGAALDNAVAATDTISTTVNARARIRSTPDSSVDANILTALEPGTGVVAYGRNEGADWVKVVYDDTQAGWTAAFLLTDSAGVSGLPVLTDFNAPRPAITPLESLTLTVPDGGCDGAAGALFYTPPNVEAATVVVNGVGLSLGSTVLVTPTDDSALRFEVFEGDATLRTPDGIGFLVAGTQATVALSADGLTPAGAPSETVPTEAGRAEQFAPLVALLTPAASEAAETVVFAPPLPADQIEAEVEAAVIPYGMLPGEYRAIDIQRTAIIEPTPGAARCGEFIRMGQAVRLVPTERGLNTGFDITITGGAAVYGDPLARHSSPEVRTLPNPSGSFSALSIVVNSPTQFTWRNTFAYRLPNNGANGACELSITYDWSRP